MSLENPKLILYSRLDENEIPAVGWPSEYLTTYDKDLARDLCCFEIRIDGLGTDNLLLDEQARELLRNIAWKLCDGRLGAAYLVLFEHTPSLRSRIRSYKGVFPYKGEIKKGEYIEFEFEFEASTTFFGGMAPVTRDNREECLALVGLWGFIVIASGSGRATNIYTREFLESIINCLDTKGGIHIDTLKLIPRVCSQGPMILSFSSDQDDFLNIGFFFDGNNKDAVQREMRNAVNEATGKLQL
jgi:hypothetical protein